MCWYTKYFEDEELMQLFKRETKKKFDGLISDLDNCQAEAVTRMLERLNERSPLEPANPRGFLFAMFKNNLVDIHREIFGRPRPPTLMKREGPVISKIFTLFCLNKKSVDEISTSLMVHRDIVRKWTVWLTENNRCPNRPSMVSIESSGGEGEGLAHRLSDPDDPDPTAQDTMDSEESAILNILRELLQQSNAGDAETLGDKGPAFLQQLEAELQLTDEQAIMVNMRFVEGMTITAAARELDISRKAFEREEQAVLIQLRQVFTSLGIER